MLSTRLALITALIAAPAAAQQSGPQPAQTPSTTPQAAVAIPANPQVVRGATVTGPLGYVVGTISQVTGDVAVVDTGMHKAPLPVSAFGRGAAGPTLTVTRDQLNELIVAQLDAMRATRDAALMAGTAVRTADGQPIGSVESVQGDSVVIAGAAGSRRLVLPRGTFAVEAAGLTTRLTRQDIDEAVRRAGVAAPVDAPPAAARRSD